MSEADHSKYAIVEHAGRQFHVEEGDVFTVDRVDGEVGASIEFGRSLVVSNGAGLKVGTPFVEGYTVKATILGHDRGRKILVFKFKHRKGYRKMRGHRQELSKLRIDKIGQG